MPTTTSPFLPPAPRSSPTASRESPCTSAIAVDRLGHGLLVGAALGGAALALLGELLELLLLVAQPLELLLELVHLREQRALGLVLALVGLAGSRRPCAP